MKNLEKGILLEKVSFFYITDEKEGIEAIRKLSESKYLYIDTEVAVKSFKDIDFFGDRVRLIQIGNEEDIFIFDMFKVPQVADEIKQLLESRGIVGHNLKFDIKFLKTNFDIFPRVVFDTMIASQILSEGEDERHSLAAVTYRLTEHEMDKSQQASAWGMKELTREQIEYSAKDVEVLREIFSIQKERLNSVETPHKATGKIRDIFGIENAVAAVEMAFLPELANMELIGMPVDEKSLKERLRSAEREYQREYIDFVRKYGVDPFSPQQVTRWLTRLGLELPKTQKGSLSSQDSALRKYIDREEVNYLLKIRSYKKVIDKLKELDKYCRNGRIHSTFKQIGAPTGRMASMHPNLQNIPHELRDIFRAPEGKKLIIADYSQIELRIAAEYVNDETMIRAFQEGKDLHRFTASLLTGKNYESITKEERQLAKAINFGLIYGISPRSLMEYARNNYEIEITYEQAQEFHRKFFEVYQKFKEWHERVKENLKEHNRITVVTLLGRRIKARRFTDAVNYPIQGTGSDLLKMAVAMFGKLKKDLKANVVNLVHDEIIVETDEKTAFEAKNILAKSMEKSGKILLKKVPVAFEIEIVDNWAEK